MSQIFWNKRLIEFTTKICQCAIRDNYQASMIFLSRVDIALLYPYPNKFTYLVCIQVSPLIARSEYSKVAVVCSTSFFLIDAPAGNIITADSLQLRTSHKKISG